MKTFALILAPLFFLAACDSATTDGSGAGNGSGYGSAYGNGVDAGTQEDFSVNVGDRVFYATDSHTLSNEAQATLKLQSEWLAANPDLRVTVEGHADERGTREYNLALGERRANSAKNYLVSLGVSPSRVSTVSYGKERPAVIGSNSSAWAQNRRAVTVVSNY